MKKLNFITAIVVLLTLQLEAQNEVDALRYSTTSVVGTARYTAMGGAFGALGADFSTLSSNPAGIGLYKSSEFTITPSLYIGSTNSTYMGMMASDNKTNFNLGNAGFVVAREMPGSSVLKNYQLGFGINRTNNFNNRILIEGYNGTNSINDTWIDNANGIYFGDIETDSYGYYAYDLNPAWWTYLLDTIPGTVDQYYGPVLNAPGQEILQREESTTWGSMNEFLFSFGGNFGDRLYLGGTFGFPMIRYFRETRYSEIDENNVLNDFNSLQLFERLQTRASGFNMKFGMIVRATDWLRIGGAIHSPTWYSNMQDEWYSELSSSFDNGDRYSERSPVGYYDYKLETPWRAMGSLGFIIAKTALLDLDYEFVDYASSRLRGSDYGFNDENRVIRDNYSETHNFRAGAEYRIGHFALRGGGGYSASPFKNDLNDGEKIYYSGGFGYRDKDFFVDFAWVRSQMNQNYYLYGSENVSVEPADNKFVTNNFMVTFGVRY